MNFSVNKSILSSAINIVTKALPVKASIPVLECILIEAAGTTVTLTCSDISMTIETSFEAEISTTGRLAVSGKLFTEIIRKMSGDTVSITGDTEGITINSLGSKINVMAFPADDFPTLPRFENTKNYVLQQPLLRQMINQTIFATAPEGFVRQILTGCLFEVEDNCLNIVALDTVRLAVRTTYLDGENEPVRAVIPASALNEVSKILSDDDSEVEINFQTSNALFKIGCTRVFTRLYEGEYLKYRSFIPQSNDLDFIVSRSALLDAVDRAWLMVRENIRNNYIVFNINTGKLVITSRSETGNVYEEIDLRGTVRELQIAFNAKYFVDCLKNIDDDEIRICMTTNRSPCIVKPVDNNKKIYLILPVKM